MTRSNERRRLTQREKRALDTTPGLIVHKVNPEGRSRLEQLAPESDERRKAFARRLTDNTPISSEGE